MTNSKVGDTIKNYFRTTTLHGFKYLCSIHFVDRIGWLVCCCASACCAGVLCAVLWARFLEVPALLALSDDIRSPTYVKESIPAIAVCPSPESVTEIVLEELSINSTIAKRIPVALARILAGKTASKEQLVLLDDLLSANNLTLYEVMINYTPNCTKYVLKCRFQKKNWPCEQLFEKELIHWGLCCVLRPERISNISMGFIGRTHTTKMLDFVLQCSHGDTLSGCQFMTVYEGQEGVAPQALAPGYHYQAQLRFTAIPENPSTNLVQDACVHDTGYSRKVCMKSCTENACGCSDPFQYIYTSTNSKLSKCSATRMICLRDNKNKTIENFPCHCLSSCSKITADLVLEASPMNVIQHAIDPLYSGVNITPSIVVNLRVNVAHSRVFLLNPTETWLTLLSSLGGVFNMFLGVGLFSALEFLFLILVKLPAAIKKSSEIDPTARITPAPDIRY